jgi:hypothetical protein
MENFIFLLAPIVVSLITTGIKKLRTVKFNKSVLRVIVAVLSFGSVLGTALLSGEQVNVAHIETFVEAIFVFLSSTGVYLLSKKKTKAD